MSKNISLDTLNNFNNLFIKALSGKSSLPDELVNFLCSEFDYQAAALFSVDNESLLTVNGISSKTRKNYIHGAKLSCNHCKLLNEQSGELSFNTDTNCSLQISEFVIYEGCLTFHVEGGSKFLIKIAKQTPFSHLDNLELEKTAKIISTILKIWLQANGTIPDADKQTLPEIFGQFAIELRKPVNNIIGFTSILAEENLSLTQKEYVRNIKGNIRYLLSSLNEAADLSKLEAGTLPTTKSEVKLNELVSALNLQFNEKYPEYDFLTSNEFDSNSVISIDEQKLRFVLVSVLESAHLLSDSHVVRLNSYKASNNAFKFEVTSGGSTLSTKDLSTLFSPFGTKKINSLSDSAISGITFYLAKKILGLFGGTISAGLNSTGDVKFSISLVGEAKKLNIREKLEAVQNSSINSTNDILVVEDDYATSKLLSNYLNKWGYQPTIVNSEQQIFDQLRKKKYLAVILDIELPNINGLQLIKKVHDNPESKNIPVIVCSVEAEEQKAFMMGAVEYFVKPINYNYLVEVLTSYKLRKNSNVLCVDDDVPTLNLVKQAIETAGFIPIAEHISANVMDLIKDKDIDLAIVDLDMPHPNGFELIKLIKSNEKFAHLPIIIYTGKENYAEDLRNIEGLFDSLLDKKSSNIEDLSATINQMITRYETPPPVEEVIEKTDTIKILLAEDYKHSQIIVTRLLKKNNFENIVVVENGEEALNMAKKEKFDLILMDMQMPVMNGFEATSNIRKLNEYKDTPIIALTAFAMKGDMEKCLEAGATDYIPKPIDSKEFIEKVKYYTKAQ